MHILRLSANRWRWRWGRRIFTDVEGGAAEPTWVKGERVSVSLPLRPLSSFECTAFLGAVISMGIESVIRGPGSTVIIVGTAFITPMAVVVLLRRSREQLVLHDHEVEVKSGWFGLGSSRKMRVDSSTAVNVESVQPGWRLANSRQLIEESEVGIPDSQCDVRAYTGGAVLELARRQPIGVCLVAASLVRDYFQKSGIDVTVKNNRPKTGGQAAGGHRTAATFGFGRITRDRSAVVRDLAVMIPFVCVFVALAVTMSATSLPWWATATCVSMAGFLVAGVPIGVAATLLLLGEISELQLAGDRVTLTSRVGPFVKQVELRWQEVLLCTVGRSSWFVIEGFGAGTVRPLYEIVVCDTRGSTYRLACGHPRETLEAAVRSCQSKGSRRIEGASEAFK